MLDPPKRASMPWLPHLELQDISRTEPSPYTTRAREENEAYIKRAQRDGERTLRETIQRDDQIGKRNNSIYKSGFISGFAGILGGLGLAAVQIGSQMSKGLSWGAVPVASPARPWSPSRSTI